MKTLELAPYGTLEVRFREEWEATPREERNRDLLKALRRKHGVGVIEVYGVIYDTEHPKPAIFDRQYTLLGRVTPEQAEALVSASTVTSDWDGYSVGNASGYTVWIAHPESPDGKRAAERA
jgi:hypothetical protein